jgi:hypothetical protein
MASAVLGRLQAWQPLTFRGVAQLAKAPVGRLAVVQAIVAILAAATFIWFLGTRISPVIDSSLQNLPENAVLVDGKLEALPHGLLGENKFFSIAFAPEPSQRAGRVADVHLELQKFGCTFSSLFGDLQLPFPAKRGITLARSTSVPWYGAWEPVLVSAAGLFGMLLIWLSWTVLGFVYSWWPKLLAYFADRELSWGEASRLAQAALLPGALVAILSILLYGWQALDLVSFLLLFALHGVVPWIYLCGAPFFLPRKGAAAAVANPFTPAEKKVENVPVHKRSNKGNPFS